MEEKVEFKTNFGLTKNSFGLAVVVQLMFWVLLTITFLQTPPDNKNGWIMYALVMAASPIVFYLVGLIFAVQEKKTFNSYRKLVLDQEEEERKDQEGLFDLVVKKFSPNSIGIDKEAEIPTVTFEVGGSQRTICKMGDTYYEVVDLD